MVRRWLGTRIAAAALMTVIVLACSGRTWHQVHYWRNSQALLTHALELDPTNHIAHANLGVVLGSAMTSQGRLSSGKTAPNGPQFRRRA